MSPDKHTLLPVKSRQVPKGLICEFLPKDSGLHSLIATINGNPIEGSPGTLVVEDQKPAEEETIQPVKENPVKSVKPYTALEEAIREMKVSLIIINEIL